MITFIHGTDSYRVKNRVDELVASLSNNKADVSYFDLSAREDLNKFTNAVKTAGLFARKEALVVSNVFAGASIAVADLIKEYKLADDRERFLIFAETNTEVALKKSDKELYKYLTSRTCKSETVNPLTDAQLINWIGIEGKRNGITIDPASARKLIDYITDASQTYGAKAGDSTAKDKTWRLHNEITKLAHYKNSTDNKGDKNISAADVELLVNPALGVNIFQLTDSIASRNKSQATVLLDKAIKNGTDPHYLFSMIVYQFRNLLTIKSMMKNAFAQPAIVAKTKLHPFVVRKTSAQAQKYELEELKRYFTKLTQLEIDSKSGTIDLTDGLYQFVLAI